MSQSQNQMEAPESLEELDDDTTVYVRARHPIATIHTVASCPSLQNATSIETRTLAWVLRRWPDATLCQLCQTTWPPATGPHTHHNWAKNVHPTNTHDNHHE